MIETRHLQYFLAIAQEENITKAADYLHIAQPTLSKQMMELEERLGKQLFIRGKRKITLTEEGTYLRQRAEEIMAIMEKTEKEFHDDDYSLSGDVYIGCGEYPSSRKIMQILCDIRKKNPGIHYHFFSSNADTILTQMDAGILDMGLLLDPEITDRYDYVKLNLSESWGILMPADSKLCEKESISFSDLTGLPIIMPSQSSNHKHFKNSFIEKTVGIDSIATYNLIYNAGLMVEAGIGYALCLQGLLPSDLESGHIFRPLSPGMESSIYLCKRKHSVSSKVVKMIVNHLLNELKMAN